MSNLALCIERRNDDAPRRVWGDEVGGERGELVQLQCDLAALDDGPRARARRLSRVRALLAAHGEAWAALPVETAWEFRRGFVDWVSVDAGRLLARPEALAASLPLLGAMNVTGLVDEGDPAERFKRLLELPLVRRTPMLSFERLGRRFQRESEFGGSHTQWLDLVTIDVLIESGLRPRGLAVRGLEPLGLQALHDAGLLANLEVLRLELVGDAPLNFALLPAVTTLALRVQRGSGQLGALPAALRELSVTVDDFNLLAIAESPAAPGLQRLRLQGSVGPDTSTTTWAAFRALRGLDLSRVSFDGGVASRGVSPDTVRSVTTAPLPNLRELRAPRLAFDHQLSVARAFGPQLELLDLRGQTAVSPQEEERLRSLVAGEVLFGAPLTRDDALRCEVGEFDPWLA